MKVFEIGVGVHEGSKVKTCCADTVSSTGAGQSSCREEGSGHFLLRAGEVLYPSREDECVL